MGVTVLLPVWRCEASMLERSFRSICEQSYEDLEILVILNGSDQATRDAARALCAGEERAWLIELERANLAAALNAGLGEARHSLVARMDADDVCAAGRIERQVQAMREAPAGAVGSAYEIVNRSGGRLGVVTPPGRTTEARWKLLVDNPFAHGSMLLDRDAVLAAGGYDESFERSQDYDLWVRLADQGGVYAVPEVLYSLTRDDRAFGATETQGVFAARVMARAWAGLAPGRLDEAALASMCERQDVSDAVAGVEARMEADGPTMADLAAWLFGRWASPGSHLKAFDVARASRVREVGEAMRAAGAERCWVWGAGRHTGWLMEHRADLGVEIAGLVDDALAGQSRFGMEIHAPAVLRGGDHVVLSSDWHEDALWASSLSARARGVRVWRVYAENADPMRAAG